MSETTIQDLGAASETSLMAVHIRAMESQRSDAMIDDEKAVALVAREMGIPAVFGCGNATMRLKTGNHVRVDGGRGVVEISTR